MTRKRNIHTTKDNGSEVPHSGSEQRRSGRTSSESSGRQRNSSGAGQRRSRGARSKPRGKERSEVPASVSDTQPSINQQKNWYKADLHLHTMASNDYEDPRASYVEWMRQVAAQDLDIVAITDHNTVAGISAIRKEIEWLTRLEGDGRLTKDEAKLLEEWRQFGQRTLVLPGFEFTATFGFHILGIFPPQTTVRQLEHILLTLNVPAEKLDVGSTETGASTDVLTAYRVIHEAGGIVIAAHANSSHGVAMRDFPFGGQTKIAYTQDPLLDALEVTDLEKKRGRTTARFFNGTKTEYPRRMHCIQGSDAHRLETNKKSKRLGIGERATDFFLEAPTFDALKKLLRSGDFNYSRPARPKDQPFDPVEAAREEGPGIALSFHESASQRGGKLTAILSDLCAFANTVGGTVYIGASQSKPKPKGLADSKEIQQEIQSALEERITPPLDVQIDTLESQQVSVLRLTVPKGPDRPYCLDEFKFYTRDETDTTLAVRDEIVALVRAVDAERKSQSGRGSGDSSSRDRRGRHRGPTNNGSDGQKQIEQPSTAKTAENGSAANEADDAFYLPQIGVEIIESTKRKGSQAHSIRDMRNGNIIKNVTRKGSRKLWNYAIQQHEDRSIQADKINWQGNIGLVNVDKRAGKIRYDLALRENGNIRIFYGVTEDGMEGRWSVFVQDEDE